MGYHDMFWYPVYGQERIRAALGSDWGRLFANWGKVPTDARNAAVGLAHIALPRARP